MSSTIVRPIQTRAAAVARYRWPLQKRATPTHCVCGARLLAGEFPTASFPIVDVSCLYCSRVVCELVWDGLPAPMTPERFAALPKNRGRECGPLPDPDAAPARVVKALENGAALSIEDLCRVLHIEAPAVRVAIHVARKRHATIVRRGGRYALGGEAP